MPRGSLPGEHRGGRKKGTKNASTKMRIAVAKEAASLGLTPLEYILTRMRDEAEDPRVRLAAASIAAPYIHPKLVATEISGPNKGPVVIDSNMSPQDAYALLLKP